MRDAAPSAHIPSMSLQDMLDLPPPDEATLLRQPAQQLRARQTVNRIFVAARGIVIRAGLGGLTVPEVTGQAAVTEPTFYRYFSGIDHLVREGVRRTAIRRMRYWVEIIEARDFTDEQQVADLLADLGTKHLMDIRGVAARALKNFLPHMNAIMAEVITPVSTALCASMRRGGMQGAENIDEATMDAILVGMLRSATSLAATDLALLRSDRARRVASAMLLAGLRAAAESTPRIN